MKTQSDNQHEALLKILNHDPEYRKSYRKLKPRYDLIKEMIRLRNELGITQKELAEKAHTHQSRISKIEAGTLNISLNTLVEIAEALEAEVDIKLNRIHQRRDVEYYQLFATSSATSPVVSSYHDVERDSFPVFTQV